MKRSGVLSISIMFFLATAFLNPATAKVMSVEDFNGNYYGARIMDIGETFDTSLYEITADGNGGVSFITIEGSLGALTTEYDIDAKGLITSQDGIIKGSISPDGTYLAIGKFSDFEPPQLLFAIERSDGLTNEIVSGTYNIFLLYEISGGEDGPIINSNTGNFSVTNAGVLSGSFTEDDPEFTFSGAYTVDYTVAEDGRLTLSFTDGQNAPELGPMHGVVSRNGNTFVAVDTTDEGARAYAVGIQQSESTEEDLAGDYYVTDFGYYNLDSDDARDDAAGFLMDFRAVADGTFSFEQTASSYDTTPIEREFTGTYALDEWHQFFIDFDDYAAGIKTGGTLNLTPGGRLFSLTYPTSLGIGIEQASGTSDPATELTENGGDNGDDDSCFINSIRN